MVGGVVVPGVRLVCFESRGCLIFIIVWGFLLGVGGGLVGGSFRTFGLSFRGQWSRLPFGGGGVGRLPCGRVGRLPCGRIGRLPYFGRVDRLPYGRIGRLPYGRIGRLPFGRFGKLPYGRFGRLPYGRFGRLPCGRIGRLPCGRDGRLPYFGRYEMNWANSFFKKFR